MANIVIVIGTLATLLSLCQGFAISSQTEKLNAVISSLKSNLVKAGLDHRYTDEYRVNVFGDLIYQNLTVGDLSTIYLKGDAQWLREVHDGVYEFFITVGFEKLYSNANMTVDGSSGQAPSNITIVYNKNQISLRGKVTLKDEVCKFVAGAMGIEQLKGVTVQKSPLDNLIHTVMNSESFNMQLESSLRSVLAKEPFNSVVCKSFQQGLQQTY